MDNGSDIIRLSPQPIFWSLQGEGHLRGVPMVFVRLAGCSVGCAQCDTDYSVGERTTIESVCERVDSLTSKLGPDRWVWVTGGEPSDQRIGPLLLALRSRGNLVALATSGVRSIIEPADWLSVSYHGGYELRQKYGHELKLIDGLHGLSLSAAAAQVCDTNFWFRYVQPLSVTGRESRESLDRCLRFVEDNPGWCLSQQDHHRIGVP